MSLVARNVIQTELVVDRAIASWITSRLTEDEIAMLSSQGPVEAAVVRGATAAAMRRFASELEPAQSSQHAETESQR